MENHTFVHRESYICIPSVCWETRLGARKLLLYKESVGTKNKNLCTVKKYIRCYGCTVVLMRVHVFSLTNIKFWLIYMEDVIHTQTHTDTPRHTHLTLQLLVLMWLLSLPLCWSLFNVWINTKDHCVQVCVSDTLLYVLVIISVNVFSAVSSQACTLQWCEPALSWPPSVGW